MKRLICIICIISISCGFAQTNSDRVKKDVDILKVKNKSLFAVLDTVLLSESQKHYYSQNLVYSIYQNQDNLVVIEALGEGRFDTDFHPDKEMGLIRYKSHLFFIEGPGLDKTLFRRTNQKHNFPFLKDKTGEIDPQTGAIFIKLRFDEYYDIWVYKYINKKFTLFRHVNM